MISYQTLVDGVRERAELGSGRRARAVVTAVISTLAHELPGGDRRELAEILPGSIAATATVPGPAEDRSGDALVLEVGERLDEPAERARYLTQAVLDQLGVQDPAVVDWLATRLPPEVVDTLRPAGQPPREAVTTTPDRPTRLSDDDVASALRRLPNWSGDVRGISRTVSIPDDRIEPLLNQVQRRARRMNDHAHVESSAGSVTFTLRTGRATVTEPDLRLAEEIDDAVAQVASGG